VTLYRALARSLASEHASRLTAMHAAERNIEERLFTLRGEFQRRRQEAVTTELLDIVSGFEALAPGPQV
jgi:F-type H+-transporting ATPase subunit gamma